MAEKKGYNPCEERNLNMTQPDKTTQPHEREPLGDVIRSGDIQSGVSKPKRIDQRPGNLQLVYRFSSIITVAAIAAAIFYSFISNLIAVFQGK